jgi:hypothetical protein
MTSADSPVRLIEADPSVRRADRNVAEFDNPPGRSHHANLRVRGHEEEGPHPNRVGPVMLNDASFHLAIHVRRVPSLGQRAALCASRWSTPVCGRASTETTRPRSATGLAGPVVQGGFAGVVWRLHADRSAGSFSDGE